MWDIFQYLQSPHLVARIQAYYGVVKIDTSNKSTRSFDHDSNPQQQGIIKRYTSSERNIDSPTDYTPITNPTLENEAGATTQSKVSDEREDDTFSSASDVDSNEFKITCPVWHYLFLLGTALGDEIFYATFIPFWFWNVDGAVGRRVVMVWAITMYIGQGIKDIVRWPRPRCPPVVQLQKKWALEYGMPSTHAMVGVTIPFSVILYTMNRYQYSVPLGIVVAVCWCTLICTSRLYLGMHTALDIVAGLALAVVLMIPLVPIVDLCDHYLLTNEWAPLILTTIAISLVVFYPTSDRWTPTRSDTTMVLSVCVGIQTGAWTNFQLGNLHEASTLPPYSIIWPSYEMLGLGTLRTVIGFSCIVATRAICKSASYATLCALLRLNSRELKRSKHSIDNQHKNIVELSYTFITYSLLGFNTSYFLPNVFRLLGIERPTFYTEI